MLDKNQQLPIQLAKMTQVILKELLWGTAASASIYVLNPGVTSGVLTVSDGFSYFR